MQEKTGGLIPYQVNPVEIVNVTDGRMRRLWNIVRICLTLALLSFGALMFLMGYLTNSRVQSAGYATDRSPADPPAHNRAPEPPQIDPEQIAREFWHDHQFLVERCRRKDQQALAHAAAELNVVFNLKRENVPQFLDDLFSFKSKGKMAYYFVRGNNRLEDFMELKTEQYFGGSGTLQAEVDRITDTLKMELRKNHNELILALEADLAALPYSLNIRNAGSADFQRNFNSAFDAALKGMLPRTVGMQLGIEAVTLALDIWVASAIGARIAGALASAGIIAGGSAAAGGTAVAGGASLAPWTAGISIVVGVAIAVGIDWAGNKVAKASAEEKIVAALEDWRNASMASFNAKAARGIDEFSGFRMLALKEALIKGLSMMAQNDAN